MLKSNVQCFESFLHMSVDLLVWGDVWSGWGLNPDFFGIRWLNRFGSNTPVVAPPAGLELPSQVAKHW